METTEEVWLEGDALEVAKQLGLKVGVGDLFVIDPDKTDGSQVQDWLAANGTVCEVIRTSGWGEDVMCTFQPLAYCPEEGDACRSMRFLKWRRPKKSGT